MEILAVAALVLFLFAAIAFLGIGSGSEDEPDVERMWDIDEIADLRTFLEFVFSHATEKERWICSEVRFVAPKKAMGEYDDLLDGSSLDVQLSAEGQSRARRLLALMDPDHPPFSQSIEGGADQLLYAIDYLSCCWVSKRIPKADMLGLRDRGVIRCADLDEVDDD